MKEDDSVAGESPQSPESWQTPEDVVSGYYPGLPEAAYHAAPAVGQSGLALVQRAPALYYAEHLDPEAKKREETWAQQFGRAAHQAVLEPERFERTYAQAPTERKQSKAEKAQWAEWEEAGYILWRTEQWDALRRIQDAVRSHPYASKVFAHGAPEVSFFARDPDWGEAVKARLDWARWDVGVVADLKTVDDASPRAFQRAVPNNHWHFQAALYPDVIRWSQGWDQPVDFIWIAVEKQPPHLVGCYYADETLLGWGRQAYQDALMTYHACREEGRWPGYTDTVEPVEAPPWATQGFRTNPSPEW